MARLNFAETEITAGALGGLLLAPTDTEIGPILLIIPGSGPTDRDGNSPLGIRAATYRLMAEDLARQGIASLRIDKRGLFSSAVATQNANDVTIADYVDDIGHWIDRIHRLGSSSIFLAGHSEGGLVALAAAAGKPVAGIVLLASPGRKFGDILTSQLQSNPANTALLPEAMAAIEALSAQRRVDDSILHPALRPIFRADVQRYLMDLFTYDPIVLLRQIAVPVLVLQGTRDLQIGTEDALALAAVRSNIELLLLPEVNHVLKTVTQDDRASNLATYGDPDLPISSAVADAVAAFIRKCRA